MVTRKHISVSLNVLLPAGLQNIVTLAVYFWILKVGEYKISPARGPSR